MEQAMVYAMFAIMLTTIFVLLIVAAPGADGACPDDEADPTEEGDRIISTAGNNIDNDTIEYRTEEAGKYLQAE